MKRLFSLLFVIAFATSLQAQVSSMQFTQTPGVYTEIAGDTVVASATTTNSSATSLDDVIYSSNTLPFAFNFNGNPYTNVAISSNGFITFGATLPSGTSYVPISATTAYAGAIAPHGRDLIGTYGTLATATLGSNVLTGVAGFAGVIVGRVITGAGIPANTTIVSFDQGAQTITLSAASTANSANTAYQIAAGSIVRGTTGTVGNRVHTIQWKNFRRFTTTGTVEIMNFQIKLYENGNTIECVYGTYIPGTITTSGQTGLRGALSSDFNNRTTTSNWAATTAGATNTATMTFLAGVFPASGQTYRWSAPLSTDVGVLAINSPGNPLVDKGATIAPKATIRNFGTAAQGPFNTRCEISPGGYVSTRSESLNPGESKTLTFDSTFVPTYPNVYTVRVFTMLPGDQNTTNDTLVIVVRTIAQNYGQDSGYFYANSNALNQPSFPDPCLKDTTGSISLVVNGLNASPGLITGSLDDGYFRLKIKDIMVALNQDTNGIKAIKFNGNIYDSVFVGTNGIIGFTQAFGVTSLSSFNVDGGLVADHSIQPMWHDFNSGSVVSAGSNRISVKIKGNQLIVTYAKIQSFAPTTDWATFQVVIELVKGVGDQNSNWRVTFADSLNGTSGSFVANYLAQYNANLGDVTTFRNYIVGWAGTGAVTPYAGFISSGNPFPASPQTQVNVKRPLFDKVTGAGLAIEFGQKINTLNSHDCLMLNVLMSLEGLQYSVPQARVRDTVVITLRDASVAPYKILEKKTVRLDSMGNKGRADHEFTMLKRGGSYYITIEHRNSIKSWSNIVSTVGNKITYDFTTGIGQTFGSNAVVVNGLASFYTGDITQDGIVDGADAGIIDNDAFVFLSGDYLISDLNWDGITDGLDASLADNNAFSFIGEVKPPGANSAVEETGFGDSKDNVYAPLPSSQNVPDPYMKGIIKGDGVTIEVKE